MDTSKAPSTDIELAVQETSKVDKTESEPLAGLKLAFMLGSLTLAAFLMFLDSSIISTVSYSTLNR